MFPYFFWAWLPTHVQNIPKSSPYIPNMKLNTSKSIKTGNVFETGNSISIRHCLAKHSLLNQRWHSTTLKWVLEVPVNSLVNSQGLSMIELVSVEGSLFVQFRPQFQFFQRRGVTLWSCTRWHGWHPKRSRGTTDLHGACQEDGGPPFLASCFVTKKSDITWSLQSRYMIDISRWIYAVGILMFWLQELYPVLGRAAGDRQSAAMAAAQGGGMRWKLGCIGTMDWFKGKFTGKPHI